MKLAISPSLIAPQETKFCLEYRGYLIAMVGYLTANEVICGLWFVV